MSGQPRSSESWDRVLAAIEADAAKAAALLMSDDASVQAGIEYDDVPAARPPGDDAPTDVPATWRLPGDPSQADAGLPASSDMPPIPPELRDRIIALRTRITQLQSDLSDAMAEARQSMRSTESRPTPERPPELIDRRL